MNKKLYIKNLICIQIAALEIYLALRNKKD